MSGDELISVDELTLPLLLGLILPLLGVLFLFFSEFCIAILDHCTTIADVVFTVDSPSTFIGTSFLVDVSNSLLRLFLPVTI
jgi:hypothetical protein